MQDNNPTSADGATKILNALGLLGGATLLLSPWIIRDFIGDFRTIKSYQAHYDKVGEYEKNPDLMNKASQGFNLLRGKLSSGLEAMGKDVPIYKRSWFYHPGLNGGFIWHAISDSYPYILQSIPHSIES